MLMKTSINQHFRAFLKMYFYNLTMHDYTTFKWSKMGRFQKSAHRCVQKGGMSGCSSMSWDCTWFPVGIQWTSGTTTLGVLAWTSVMLSIALRPAQGIRA